MFVMALPSRAVRKDANKQERAAAAAHLATGALLLLPYSCNTIRTTPCVWVEANTEDSLCMRNHWKRDLLYYEPSVHRLMMFKHSVALVNVTNMMSEVIEIGGLSILSRETGL